MPARAREAAPSRRSDRPLSRGFTPSLFAQRIVTAWARRRRGSGSASEGDESPVGAADAPNFTPNDRRVNFRDRYSYEAGVGA
jgi:hypothetical protein